MDGPEPSGVRSVVLWLFGTFAVRTNDMHIGMSTNHAKSSQWWSGQ